MPEGVGISPRYDIYQSEALVTLISDLPVVFLGKIVLFKLHAFLHF